MNDQLKGMLDRALIVFATTLLGWMVKKGWISESDSAVFLPALVALPAIAWGAYNNRAVAQLQKAGRVVGEDGKKTVVVTSPELANATPNEANIISTSSSQVAINKAIATATETPGK